MSKPEQAVLANLTAYLMSSITNGLHHWWEARLLSSNAVNGLEALLRPVVHDPDPAALVVLDKLAWALNTTQSQNALAALYGNLARIQVSTAAADQRVHAALRQAVSAAQLAWWLDGGANDQEGIHAQAQQTLETWGFAVPHGFELTWTAGIGPGQLLVKLAKRVTGANLPAGVLLHCLTRLLKKKKKNDPGSREKEWPQEADVWVGTPISVWAVYVENYLRAGPIGRLVRLQLSWVRQVEPPPAAAGHQQRCQIIADPLTEGSRRFLMGDFVQALEDALAAACQECADARPPGSDLVWRLRSLEQPQPGHVSRIAVQPAILQGNSLGLALAVGAMHLLKGTIPDHHVLCMGSVGRGGNVGDVGGYAPKSIAGLVTPKSPINKLVVPVTCGADVAASCALAVGLSEDSVRMVRTLKDAYNEAGGLIDAVVAYLKDVIQRTDEAPPKLLPERLQGRGFQQIRQRVRVVAQREELLRWLEQLRAAGQPTDYWAYLPQRARPELGEDRDDERWRRGSVPSPPPTLPTDYQRARPELDEDRDDERWRRGSVPSPPPTLDWDDEVADDPQYQRLVLLGDPGFGKSRLLQHEARRLAIEALAQLEAAGSAPTGAATGPATLDTITVPILLCLTEVAEQLAKPSSTALSDPATLGDVILELRPWAQPGTPQQAWLKKLLGDERCVLLLDGWDEVLDPEVRKRLAQALQAFVRQFPGRLILSSRFAGYDLDPVPGATEIELLDFGPEQIQAFAEAWWFDDQPAESAAQHPSAESEHARRQREAFLAQVDPAQRPAVAGLARIPLMLTLLCRLFEDRFKASRDSQLPQRRVELYGACIQGLLRDWQTERDRKIVNDYDYGIERLDLSRVALSLQLAGQQQFALMDVARSMGLDLHDPKQRAAVGTQLQHWLAVGILTKAGRDRYSWIHRTFGEYLSAVALAEKINSEGWDAPLNVAGVTASLATVVDRKAWDPQWEQPIILLAGLVQGPDVLLRRMREPHKTEHCPGTDDFFHHRLALAAKCCPEVADLDTRSRLADKLAPQLLHVWADEFQYSEEAVPAIYQGLIQLGRINARIQQKPMAAHLVFQSRGPLPQELELLGQLRCHVQEGVSQELINIIKDGHRDIIGPAAKALSLLAAADATIMNQLSCIMCGSAGTDSGDGATYVLAERCSIAPDKNVIRKMFDVVARATGSQNVPCSSGEWWHLRSAWRVLKKALLHITEDQALLSEFMTTLDGNHEVLFELIRADPSINVTRSLVNGLGDCAKKEAFIKWLLERVSDPAHAAHALRTLRIACPSDEALLTRLLCILSKDTDEERRRWAATLIGEMGHVAASDQRVAACLLKVLEFQSAEVQQAAVQAMRRLGPALGAHIGILEHLVELLCQDHDRRLRECAAGVLGSMGPHAAAQPDVVPRLLALLDQPEERHAAIHALYDFGPTLAHNEQVVASLLKLLNDSHYETQRRRTMNEWRTRDCGRDIRIADHWKGSAAEVLGRCGPAIALGEKVVIGLMNALPADVAGDHGPGTAKVVRALSALGPIAAQQRILVSRLLMLMGDIRFNGRDAAFNALAHHLGQRAALRLLVRMVRSENTGVVFRRSLDPKEARCRAIIRGLFRRLERARHAPADADHHAELLDADARATVRRNRAMSDAEYTWRMLVELTARVSVNVRVWTEQTNLRVARLDELAKVRH